MVWLKSAERPCLNPPALMEFKEFGMTVHATQQTSGADFTSADEPFSLFAAWLKEAELSEPNDPNAMALATIDDAGMPNVRMVLLKGLDGPETGNRGFVFFTNFESAKGQEIFKHRAAALVFHWKSLERQIRVRGNVSVVSEAEADAYYATRPIGSRIGAWASRQSRPLESRRALQAEVAKYEAKFASAAIPRPPHWSGFRITPVEIEFWMSQPFRLHDRVVFKRSTPAGSWNKTRLFP